MPNAPENQSLASDLDPVIGSSFFQRREPLVWATAVFAATVAASIGMMPPSRYPELAYLFAAPAVYWAYRAPSRRLYLWTVVGAQALAWTIILGWLSNVTWLGLLLLGPIIGAWTGSWFTAVHWTMPRIIGRPWAQRILAVLGLAATWVVIEWTRTWFLSGFPWLPLSATQWERLSVLQPAAITGAWGVSFVLVSVNISFAAYAHKLLNGTLDQARTRCPEFIAAMVLLLGCLLLTVRETFNRARFHLPWARVGIVQPAIPQSLKWDPAEAESILKTLEVETLKAAAVRPDLLLWPEATTPLAVRGDQSMTLWTEDLVRRARVPLVMGSIGCLDRDTPKERWINGVFAVTPESGVGSDFYAKRHLVPFGEYVPVRSMLGWLEKVVPVGDDFSHGTEPAVLGVPIGLADEQGKRPATRLGSLICYEDIFPALARESVRAGAEVLVVNTNNGWFGEGAAAYQHAAHSVLRAVETRRPVLRAGNAGWSGWIDECGAIRSVLTKDRETGAVRTEPVARGENPGTVYFRGSATLTVTRDSRYFGVQTFYVRWGDWFVGLSALLAIGAWVVLRRPYIAPVKRDPATSRRFKLD